ncbi:uncharacterized protein LOC143916425 [Arctopsyche grandis]|uniref:uncharacterized protein LOC143916425 n=1 Tax=Arctopsyche grandis TaxID=121162 RepID=UPI00406D87B1
MTTGQEQFQWTTEWTEKFICLRLQNEDLFKLNKHPWKDLLNIMKDNEFPQTITLEQIRTKWYYMFKAYQKAVATNNTNFIYYDTIYNYVGNLDLNTKYENWNDGWIRKLIEIMMKNNHIFTSEKINEDDCWAIVSSELKGEGVSADCSIKSIQAIWSSLIKTFKIKHKYKDHVKASNVWDFYNNMFTYFEKCDPSSLENVKKIKSCPAQVSSVDDADVKNTLYNDDFFCKSEDVSSTKSVKNEYYFDSGSCRACLGRSEKMVEIDNNLADMMMTCAEIQMCSSDNLPQNLCQSCFEELNIAFKFKKKCEESEKYMKTVCIQQQNDIIKPTENTNQFSDEMNVDSPDNIDYNSEIDIKDEEKLSVISLPKAGKRVKSKNYVLKPVVDEFGKTVYKKKYIYRKVCEICGKSTQRMKKHMASHSDDKLYTCTKCPKTFKYIASLQTHVLTHNTTPLKVCQICGKKFFRNLAFKRHLVYHDNKRKFKCDKCGKTFNTSDILKVHYRSHTGERPYSCKECGKSFLSRGCVSRHQKVHRKKAVQT